MSIFQGTGLVNSSNEADRNLPLPDACCPSCGGRELRILSSIESHRLTDEHPDKPYVVMFVLECRCGTTFSVEARPR